MVCEYLCDFCTNGITFVRLQLCLLGMNHLQSAAPVQKRLVKVENGTRPAEDSVPTEGSRKSCQAEKSGEKKIDDMFDADSVLLSGWQLEAWQCQDCSSRSQVCLLYLQVRIFCSILDKIALFPNGTFLNNCEFNQLSANTFLPTVKVKIKTEKPGVVKIELLLWGPKKGQKWLEKINNKKHIGI